MYGSQEKFAIARQTAGGTAVTAAGSYHGFAFTSEDVGLDKDELVSQNLVGQFEQGAVYSGLSRISGTIEFELTPRNMLAALAAVVNYAPTLVTSGALGTHTFLPNTVDFDSTYVKAPWTIYKQFSDSNSAEQFYDCQMGQLELTISQGQFMKGRMTVAGGARTSTGVGSMNVGALAADVGVLFPWNVTSITYGGTALSAMSEVTISLNENVEPIYTVNGTLAPFKYSRSSFREVTVSGTFYMNDRTMLNNFVNETQQRLLITIANTRTAVQSGYFNTLVIDVPQLKITQFKPGASGPGEVSVSFTGRGVLDPSSRYAIQYTTTTTYQSAF